MIFEIFFFVLHVILLRKHVLAIVFLSNLGDFHAVILSNYYDLPFNDILNWRKFAVILKELDVYRLKQILKDIPDAEFAALHNNLVKVKPSLCNF